MVDWKSRIGLLGCFVLAGCNASAQKPDVAREARLMEQYAQISAKAEAICAARGLPNGALGNADCHYREGLAIIERRERGLKAAAVAARPTSQAPAYSTPPALEHAKIDHIELPKSCVALPLGSDAVTWTCNN